MLSPSSLPDVSVSNVVYHLVIAGTGLRNWHFLLVLTALPPDASTIPWSCGEMGEVSSPLKLRKGGDALGPRQCVLNLRASPGPIVSRWGPPTLACNDGSQGVQVCVLEWSERSHGRGEETAGCQSFAHGETQCEGTHCPTGGTFSQQRRTRRVLSIHRPKTLKCCCSQRRPTRRQITALPGGKLQ